MSCITGLAEDIATRRRVEYEFTISILIHVGSVLSTGFPDPRREIIMNRSALSIKVFGVYFGILGLGLMSIPNLLLPLFGIPQPMEVWVRVAGLVTFNEGIYYWCAAEASSTAFFKASVYLRCLTPLVFAAFVASGWAKPVLIAFGGADLSGGLWTLVALRRDRDAARVSG